VDFRTPASRTREVQSYLQYGKKKNISQDVMEAEVEDSWFGMVHRKARKYIRFKDTKDQDSGTVDELDRVSEMLFDSPGQMVQD
jgi:hypothetical protein